VLARLAGEKALQTERFGLSTADDARWVDSHSRLRAFTQRYQLGHRIEVWQPGLRALCQQQAQASSTGA
jgi:hypothetical protein